MTAGPTTSFAAFLTEEVLVCEAIFLLQECWTVRIPDAGRFELRLMDGAANPYLLQAGVLAAGLDGVANKRDPGERLDINMYTDGHSVKNLRRLPLNLLDALRTTGKSKVLRERFGDSFVDSYLKLRMDEWNSYSRHLTAWEMQNTLDC